MLRLSLPGNKHAAIASDYAPTMTNPDEMKDKFLNNDIDILYLQTSRTSKQIILARVGTDHQTLV